MNDSATPIAVAGMTNVIAAAAGNGKTVAVLADGTVWDWGGYAPYPALGNGTNDTSSTPVQVSGLSNAVAAATAEYFGLPESGAEERRHRVGVGARTSTVDKSATVQPLT